jgi:GNAT superfamily N-acetyltransferase
MSASRVRQAETEADFAAVGDLFHEFQAEYGLPSPGAAFFAARIAALPEGDVAAFLAGDGDADVGFTVARVRPNLYSEANEAYLAELYVRDRHRRKGLGSELLDATIAYARDRGCDRIELGTDEGDHDAHRLYERHGFTNFADPGAAPDDRERMFFYERDL